MLSTILYVVLGLLAFNLFCAVMYGIANLIVNNEDAIVMAALKCDAVIRNILSSVWSKIDAMYQGVKAFAKKILRIKDKVDAEVAGSDDSALEPSDIIAPDQFGNLRVI